MTLLSAICLGVCCLSTGVFLGFVVARAAISRTARRSQPTYPAFETLLTLDRIPNLLRETHQELLRNSEKLNALEQAAQNQSALGPEWSGGGSAQDDPKLISIQKLIGKTLDCSNQLLQGASTLQEQMSGLELFLREARTDSLTGLWNRRAFDENLKIQYSIARRYNTPFSIALFDLDHFKQINDIHGHPAGDEVLRQFSKIMLAGVRGCDVVTRYGGEEFAILLPQTDMAGAITLAERIRQQLDAAPILVAGHKVAIRTSAGVATCEQGEEQAHFIARADAALYQAKRAGRNCIYVHRGGSQIELVPTSDGSKSFPAQEGKPTETATAETGG